MERTILQGDASYIHFKGGADEASKNDRANDNLESMQEAVGGWIEEYMPFPDEVALICNEEGKMNGIHETTGYAPI